MLNNELRIIVHTSVFPTLGTTTLDSLFPINFVFRQYLSAVCIFLVIRKDPRTESSSRVQPPTTTIQNGLESKLVGHSK